MTGERQPSTPGPYDDDPDLVCVKCGSTAVTTRYQAPRQTWEARWLNGVRFDPAIPEGDYLLQQCDRCAFQWITPCMDARGSSQ